MEHIGYSLIDANNAEIQHWGDSSGAVVSPGVLYLPNGDHVHCPSVGVSYSGYILVERWLQYDGVESVEYDGSKIVVTRPMPIPSVISDRQFFQQLAVLGAITQDEAIASVATGTIPSAMEAFIAVLPEDQQFPARMLLQGATEFRRSNQLVEAFGSGMGWTDAQIDQLWRDAAKL